MRFFFFDPQIIYELYSVSLTGYKCRALGYLTDQLFARPKSSTVYVLISLLLKGSILPPPTLPIDIELLTYVEFSQFL